MVIDVELEQGGFDSPDIRERKSGYTRWPATRFSDRAAGLTSRQAVFYRNLIRLAERTGGDRIPVDFELPDGRQMVLDHGCIKIAELSGFIRPLTDGAAGVVENLQLAWRFNVHS
jgi:hypothetical protein